MQGFAPMKLAAAAVAAFTWGAIGSVQAAGLDGTSVDIRYDYTGSPSLSSTVVVGPGVEMDCHGNSGIAVCGYLTAGNQSVDIDTDSFTYRMTGGSGGFTTLPQNGFTFSSLNPGYPIGGVILTTNIAQMNKDRIAFTADSVSVYMSGLHVDDGSYFKVTLQPVPEPAAAALWSVGLLAVVGVARRMRRR